MEMVIDKESGLPDVSVFGDGFFWRVSKLNEHINEIQLMEKWVTRHLEPRVITNPKGRWWNVEPVMIRDDKWVDVPEEVKISSSYIVRKLPFSELNPGFVASLEGLAKNSRFFKNSRLEDLVSDDNFLAYASRQMSIRGLYEHELSDETILASAKRVFEKFAKSLEEKKAKERKENYFGDYPPKKLKEVG